MNDMKSRIKVRKDGTLEWLAPPPVPFTIQEQKRTRFSEITPCNPFLYAAFRVIRFLFGEGKWFIPEWTRRWPCRWRGQILLGNHRGESMESCSRQAVIDWEFRIWYAPKIDL